MFLKRTKGYPEESKGVCPFFGKVTEVQAGALERRPYTCSTSTATSWTDWTVAKNGSACREQRCRGVKDGQDRPPLRVLETGPSAFPNRNLKREASRSLGIGLETRGDPIEHFTTLEQRIY